MSFRKAYHDRQRARSICESNLASAGMDVLPELVRFRPHTRQRDRY